MTVTDTRASGGDAEAILFKIRLALLLFIGGLVISGITAFPLLGELNFLVRWTGARHVASTGGYFAPLAQWVVKVRDGLDVTYAAFPFIGYGTDWLAFGHLIIALFFIGPMIDPVRNVFILRVGCWACVLVLPLALICGPIRGIPVYWRLIDCSFGVLGLPFLWYCLRQTTRLEALRGITTPSGGR